MKQSEQFQLQSPDKSVSSSLHQSEYDEYIRSQEYLNYAQTAVSNGKTKTAEDIKSGGSEDLISFIEKYSKSSNMWFLYFWLIWM